MPNTLVGLSRLGKRTALIAVLGNDWAGQIGLRELEKEMVGTSWLVFKKAHSATAAGFVESGSGRRTIAFHRKVGITPGDINTSRLPITRLVHLDGRDLKACLKLARWAKREGTLVSFDIGSIRNDVSSVFPLVDHLVVADAYAFPFTGARTAKRAIERLRRYCGGSLVVTEGTKGALGFEKGIFYRHPAFKVEVVDTTGAGDAFHVGYLFGLLSGIGMEGRLKLGAAAAAVKCQKPGARAGLPTRPQLLRFLKGQPHTHA